MNLHFCGLVRESNGDEAGLDRLVRRASDSAGKVGFGVTSQRYFPGNDVFVFASELTFFDHERLIHQP
jgi:hypothetical protein